MKLDSERQRELLTEFIKTNTLSGTIDQLSTIVPEVQQLIAAVSNAEIEPKPTDTGKVPIPIK